MDGSGNFMMIWYDERNVTADIYSQRYTSAGSALGANTKENDEANGASQYQSRVAVSSTGASAVTWYDDRNGNYDIYAQLYTSNGSAVGANFKVNDDAGSSYQDEPSIAMDGNGDFVVAWEDVRNGSFDIYAQRYSSNGSAVGANFKVNSDVGNWHYSPSIAMDGSGNFALTWYDNRDGNYDIYAQRYASNGSTVGANFKVNDDLGNSHYSPTLAMDGAGDFVVGWQDYRNGTSDVYAQRYSSNGSAVGANFRVNDDLGSSHQDQPGAAIDGSGNFVLSWYDERNGNGDIYAQWYASNGSTLGSNFKVNDDVGSSYQDEPSVAMDANSNAVMTWRDYRNGIEQIFGQRYLYNGSAVGGNFGVASGSVISFQQYPSIALVANQFITTWEDNRIPNHGFDIWANIKQFAAPGTFPPVNLTALDHIKSKVFLYWDPPEAAPRRAGKLDDQDFLKWMKQAATGGLTASTQGPDKYRIYRGTQSGGPYTLRDSSLTTAYVDSTVANGTIYYYVVTGVTAGVESPYSNEDAGYPVNESGTGSRISHIMSPSANPFTYGIAAVGNTLWITEYYDGKIYHVNKNSGAIISSFTAPDAQPTGLAWDGSSLWVGGLVTDAVYKVDTLGDILQSFSVPADTAPAYVAGVAYENGHIWVADRGNNMLLKFNAATGTLLGRYNEPFEVVIGMPLGPRGLAYNSSSNTLLHVVTNFSNVNEPQTYVYEFDPSAGRFTGRKFGFNRNYDASSAQFWSNGRGIAYDAANNSTWVSDAGSGVIYDLVPFSSFTPYSQMTFHVDTRNVYPAVSTLDKVGVRGSFLPLDWYQSVQMTDANGDSVYDVTVPIDGSFAGQTLEYKFVVDRSDGNITWEDSVGTGGPYGNRTVTVTAGAVDLGVVFFSNISGRPSIVVAPDSLSASLPQGQLATRTLTVSNVGTMPLYFSLSNFYSTIAYAPKKTGGRPSSVAINDAIRISVSPGASTVERKGPHKDFSADAAVAGRAVHPGLFANEAAASLRKLQSIQQVIFHDDMEKGTNGWTSGALSGSDLWHLTTTNYNSPSHSWWCGIEGQGNYDNGTRINDAVVSPPISLQNRTGATLQFYESYNTESGYDYCMVEVSTDNGSTWNQVRTPVSGSSGGWIFSSYDLTPYVGTTIRLRFHFDTGDQYVNSYPGWFFDDVTVTGLGGNWLSENPASGSVAPAGSMNVSVIVNSTGLAPGSYTGDITIFNSDPLHSMITVPVSIAVAPGIVSSVAFAQIDTSVSHISTTVGLLGFAWGDYDGDGDLDLFIGGSGSPSVLYRNDGTQFTQVPAPTGGNNGVIWADFDGDGRVDLLFTSGPGLQLFHNNGGGSFTDITAAANLTSVNQGGNAWMVSAADYDRDGDLDLVLAGSGTPSGTPVRLLQNNGAGVFTDVSNTVLSTNPSFESWNPAWVDVNNDGYPDLWMPTIRTPGTPCGLFMNNGSGQLIYKDSTITGLGVKSAIASAWGDYDNDGYMDLFIIPYVSDSAGVAKLYHNNGNGTFTNVAHAAGLDSAFTDSRGVCWGDFDNDGHLDLLIGRRNSQQLLYHNNGDGTFSEVGVSAGINVSGKDTRSVALVDYDNDGFLDMFLSGGANNSKFLFHNGGGNGNHWIGFKPVGVGNNCSAIGARIRVVAGSLKEVRDIQAGGTGGLTNGNLWANFGIGAATKVDSVIIRWPDGFVSTQTNLAGGNYYTPSEIYFNPPHITVTPDSIVASLVEGDSTKKTITIGNTGTVPLTFNITEAYALVSKMAKNNAPAGLAPTSLPRTSVTRTGAAIDDKPASVPALKFPATANVHPQGTARPSSTKPTPVTVFRKSPKTSASGGGILVIGDGGTENDVVPILQAQGYSVTLVTDDTYYNGSNPSPYGFNEVILLDGISWGGDMPLSGQDALVSYVQGGGGLLFTEWIAWEYSNGRYAHFGPLLSVRRSSGREGTETYTVIQSHPITAGLPSSFSVTSGSNIGSAVAGMVLIQGSQSGDAVVVTNVGAGRVVQFSMAGNYEGDRPFADANGQLLLVNTANWLAGGAWLTATPSSGTVTPSGTQNVNVKLNAASLLYGSYTANLVVNNNDPYDNPMSVPVSLNVTVGNRPAIVVRPDSLFCQQSGEGSQTLSFYVKNVGLQPLSFSITDTEVVLAPKQYPHADGPGASGSMAQQRSVTKGVIQKIHLSSGAESDVAISGTRTTIAAKLAAPKLSMDGSTVHAKSSAVSWLTPSPLSGTVAPGDSVKIDVMFVAAGLAAGTYTAMVNVASNDPYKPVAQVRTYLHKTLPNFTTEDNENNLLQGIPDYDMDTYLFNTDPLAPIEFNIFVDQPTIHAAQLALLAWDIDWASGERDSVVLNGHFLGYLTGADNEWSTSFFYVDSSWVIPGPLGKNLVRVYIDVLNPGEGVWATSIDWGQLILNGSAGTSHIRYVKTDTTQYGPGSTVYVTEEIDSDSLSQNVNVETDLLDPSGNIVAGTNRTLTVTPGDEPFTEALSLDPNAVVGAYGVRVVVYDAMTNLQQDIKLVPIQVVLPPPYNVVAGTGFDRLVPLTWDLAADPNASLRRNGAASLSGPMSTKISRMTKQSPGSSADFPLLKTKAGVQAHIGDLQSTGTIHGPTTVSLTVDHYNLYRGTTAGGPYTLLTSMNTTGRVYGNDADYIDTTVAEGQTYYYVITAVYTQGESIYSTEVSATPATGGQRLSSPFTSILPALDGVISPGEWNDALVRTITNPGIAQPVTMRMKNTMSTLYLAVDDMNRTSSSGFNEIGFYFDADNNRTWDPDTSTKEGNFWIDYYNDSVTVYFRGVYGNYPFVGFQSAVLSPQGVKAKASVSSGHLQYEIAFDLTSPYFSKTKDTLGVWLFAYNDSAASSYYYKDAGYWPLGSIWAAPRSYGSLILAKKKSVANTLSAGWNLISWNVDTDVDSTTTILAPVLGKLTVALGFNGGGLTYDPTLPPGFNTLLMMDQFHGYWLKMKDTAFFAVMGLPVNPQTPIPLAQSYNLVSYLPNAADSVSHALQSVLTNTTVVLGFNGGGLTYDPTIPPEFNTLKVLQPLRGYWLKEKVADTLVYPSGALLAPAPMSPVVVLSRKADQTNGVVPTREWVSMWGDNVYVNHQLLPVGTVVHALDKNGTVCGEFVVQQAGKFGLMAVYRDDPQTEADEGPNPGETFTIALGDAVVPLAFTWHAFGDVIDFTSAVTSAGIDVGDVPREFALHQNYPNPFNPSTTIQYDLPKNVHVTLKIFNVLGQEVSTLIDAEQDAGYYRVVWDGSSAHRTSVSTGIYFCSITAGDYRKTLKMLMLK